MAHDPKAALVQAWLNTFYPSLCCGVGAIIPARTGSHCREIPRNPHQRYSFKCSPDYRPNRLYVVYCQSFGFPRLWEVGGAIDMASATVQIRWSRSSALGKITCSRRGGTTYRQHDAATDNIYLQIYDSEQTCTPQVAEASGSQNLAGSNLDPLGAIGLLDMSEGRSQTNCWANDASWLFASASPHAVHRAASRSVAGMRRRSKPADVPISSCNRDTPWMGQSRRTTGGWRKRTGSNLGRIPCQSRCAEGICDFDWLPPGMDRGIH